MELLLWNNPIFLVGSILVGFAVLIVFVAALIRKGRVAFLMLPMALWFIFWLPWWDRRLDRAYSWFSDNYGIPSDSYLIYLSLEYGIAVIVCLLPLMLIFKKDKHDTPSRSHTMTDTTIVATFVTAIEANLAAQFLRTSDLLVTVEGDDGGGAFAGLSFSGGFKLRVPSNQAEIAREMLSPSDPPEFDETQS
ncbi:MAG: hypothetical protein ACKVK0_08110 [Pirellulales bacterium]|jgi:hypothetical protein